MFNLPICNIVVYHTNAYGKEFTKGWDGNFDGREFFDFIAVIFMAAEQKRRNGPNQWFSADPVLGNQCIRRLMNLKRFLKILQSISVCSLTNPRGHEAGYHPIMKVSEFKEALEKRFQFLYEPGKNLSVDETLLRPYGQIGFKVRIVTKRSRYGIKMYVCTDAVDEYVLCTSMYTGGDRGDLMSESSFKKTTQVVLDLVNHYKGTYRGIKTDRYYTSVELCIELEKIQLSNTGKRMKNRVPKELRWSPKISREKVRGEFDNHMYKYKTVDGTV